MLPKEIGPHEGREIELLLEGKKRVALFVEVIPIDLNKLPNSKFETLLFQSPPKKGVSVPVVIAFERQYHRTALRLKKLYEEGTTSTFDEEREKEIGKILGYSEAEISAYITHFHRE